MFLSPTDITMNILGLTDKESRKIIDRIPITMVCDMLCKHHYGARADRKRLIKSFKLNPEDELSLKIRLPKITEDLWNNLRSCGSGITRDMFGSDNDIHGTMKNNHKLLLSDRYSEEFIEMFEDLWKADKKLRFIEWKLLRIGSIPSVVRKNILFNLINDDGEHNNNKGTDLINLLNKGDELSEQISKALLHKILIRTHNKYLEKWYKLDPFHCGLILAETYDSITDDFDITLLESRFKNRVKSSRVLTIELGSVLK